MLGTRRDICHHLARFMVKSVLFESWLLGLLPFTFVFGKKQIKNSRLLLLYGVLLNLLTLCLFISHFEANKSISFDVYKRNPLLRQIFQKSEITACTSACIIHFMNIWRRNKVKEIANELLNLEYRYFKGINLKNCPKLNSIVIQKFITTMCQTIIMFMGTLEHRKMSPLVLIILWCLPLMGVQLIFFHFHFEIISIYRYVWLINGELLDVANNTKLDTSTKSSRINELASLYERLLKLINKVEKTYDFQLTILFANYLIYNIVISYLHIVIGVSLSKPLTFLATFAKLALIIWDFWLSIVVCGLAEKASIKTSTLLKLYADLEHRDAELERNINQFAWLCSHRKIRIQLCGLFSINYSMGFHMIITSFLYLVYLVQFDYMNL